MDIKTNFIETKSGNLYKEIVLINDNGVEVKCIDLGCIITQINVPDRYGKYENIVLGYEDCDDYLSTTAYFGAVIGRNSGRIGGAKIRIDELDYELNKNDGNNTLHGGYNGFNVKKFSFKTVKGEDFVGVKFYCISEDGEGGFPGKVEVEVCYLLNNDNEFKISYNGISDKTTVLNMTNHSYFNLSGNCKRKITTHTLQIQADKFTELDDESIVTGKMINVLNTPFDFTKRKKIGQDIYQDYYQFNITKGYDHFFKFKDDMKTENRVELYDEESGRGLLISTDCNGLVVYSGNYVSKGKLSIGREIEARDAVCLETQNVPIGKSNLFIEDSILEAGRKYSSETIYKFIVK